ncbi:MAG: TonB-dependent receptor [Sphingomonas sp.]|nr:TonB-dependent receptor [Sphingomonas sp.]
MGRLRNFYREAFPTITIMMLQALPPPEPPQAAIVITARRLPEPASDRAYSIERFDRSRLANAPSSQLDEVLKQVAGLQLFRRSDARSAHPTSQGVTLRALGGNASSRALLVLDGVPQADPFGGWVNWPAYDPAALEEIRVIRGGGSVIHGPGALAGVIAMSSGVAPGLEASAQAGSRGSQEGRLHFGAAVGRGTLSLSGRAARGDGFVPVTSGTRGPADRTSPYREGNLRGQWVTPVTGAVAFEASASGFIDQRERGLAFTGNRTDGADASLRLIGSGNWRWTATGYGQWRQLTSSFASVDADRSASTRVALQDEVPSHAYGASAEVRPPLEGAFELRLGGDARATKGQSRELYFYVSGEPTRRRRAGGETATAGIFAELSVPAGPLTLSGGARIDHWRISEGGLQERLLATGMTLRDDVYPARDGWLPTARLGAVLETSPGLTLRSAAYAGWRLPTLNELFRPFRAGADATAANPLLRPERLAGIEAGADYERNGVSLALTLFSNRLSGAIANVTLAEGPGVFPGVGFVGPGGEYRQRLNLEAIEVRGFEASGAVHRGPWTLRAGASIIDAEVRAAGDAAPLDSLRPAQTPRIALNAGLEWTREGRTAALLLRHVGRQFEDDSNQRSLGAATTIDAFTAWPIGEKLQIVFRAENLLGERVVAGIGSDGSIERATPRTLWLGLRFSRPSQR